MTVIIIPDPPKQTKTRSPALVLGVFGVLGLLALLVAVACIFGQRPRKGSKDKVRSRRAQVRSSRRIQSNPEMETEVALQKPPPAYGSWIPRS